MVNARKKQEEKEQTEKKSKHASSNTAEATPFRWWVPSDTFVKVRELSGHRSFQLRNFRIVLGEDWWYAGAVRKQSVACIDRSSAPARLVDLVSMVSSFLLKLPSSQTLTGASALLLYMGASCSYLWSCARVAGTGRCQRDHNCFRIDLASSSLADCGRESLHNVHVHVRSTRTDLPMI